MAGKPIYMELEPPEAEAYLDIRYRKQILKELFGDEFPDDRESPRAERVLRGKSGFVDLGGGCYWRIGAPREG